jgi:CPA2 family monovalent cation:H+ antiporter-2
VQMLVLVTVLSLIITPFILSKISVIAGIFFKETSMTEDFNSLETHFNHVIVCGYGVVGKFVVKALREENVNYIIVDNSYKHVLEAMADGEKAYYGDMSKMPILEKLHLRDATSVIVTLDNSSKKRLICESILTYAPTMKVVVKVISLEEKRELRGLNISVTVDGKREVAAKLVCEALYCDLEK